MKKKKIFNPFFSKFVNIFECGNKDFCKETHGFRKIWLKLPIKQNLMKSMFNKKVQGRRIGSKCDWYENGEKSTKFFLTSEKDILFKTKLKIELLMMKLSKKKLGIIITVCYCYCALL